MTKAQEQYEQPSTLEEALDVIDSLRAAVASSQEQIDNLARQVEDLQGEVASLEYQLDVAEEETSCLPDETVTDLVKIRHAIKHRTVNDTHLYQLERLLSELDSGWMCRA